MIQHRPHRRHLLHIATAAAVTVSLTALVSGGAFGAPGFTSFTSMPLPVGASSPPDAPYSAVSCPATTTCTAVGSYGHIVHEGQPSVTSESNGVWSAAAAIALPTGGVSGGETPSQLNDVSCWSVGNCVAVGQYPLSNGAVAPLIATETSGTWSTGTTVAAPTGAATGKNLYASLDSIWCDVSGNCVASGQYLDAAGKDHLMVSTESSGTWTPATELTDSSAMKSSSFDFVVTDAISCTDDTDCTVVSSVEMTSLVSMRWTEASGTWGSSSTFAAIGKEGSLLESITCPSSSFCVAVGATGSTEQPAVATDVSGTWSALKILPLPLLSPATNGGALTSVSCSSATECVAVGALTETGTQQLSEATATTWSNGSWSSLEPALTAPAGTGHGDDVALISVDCLATVPCVAIGGAGVVPYKSANEPVYPVATKIAPDVAPAAPGAPSGTTFKVAKGKAVATWLAPQSNGGSPITQFTVTATSSKEPTRTCTSSSLSCTLKDLAAKHSYSVTVVAKNIAGSSKKSAAKSFVAL